MTDILKICIEFFMHFFINKLYSQNDMILSDFLFQTNNYNFFHDN